MTVYESKGAAWADESIRPLWKEFRGLFLTRQRVSFLWLFRSQQGLWGMTNLFVTCEKSFEGYFWVAAPQFSLNVYESPGAVWAAESIRHLGKHFRGLYLNGQGVSFLNFIWVSRRCVGWWIHSSLVKAVSGTISERATTQFFMTVYESKGAAWADESIRHLWKEFRGLFLTSQRISFLWLFRS